MRKFKVAMVQHKVPTSNVGENTELAIRYITEAKADGADFVLFPECFLSAYQFPKIVKHYSLLKLMMNLPNGVKMP